MFWQNDAGLVAETQNPKLRKSNSWKINRSWLEESLMSCCGISTAIFAVELQWQYDIILLRKHPGTKLPLHM